MKRQQIFFAMLLCLTGSSSFAQTGCIIVFGVNSADTKVYTVSLGTSTTCNSQTVEKFNTSTFTPLASGCSWSPNPAASPATARNCIVGSSCGFKATYTQACPIDDYVFLIIAFAGGFAVYTVLYQTKKGNAIHF